MTRIEIELSADGDAAAAAFADDGDGDEGSENDDDSPLEDEDDATYDEEEAQRDAAARAAALGTLRADAVERLLTERALPEGVTLHRPLREAPPAANGTASAAANGHAAANAASPAALLLVSKPADAQAAAAGARFGFRAATAAEARWMFWVHRRPSRTRAPRLSSRCSDSSACIPARAPRPRRALCCTCARRAAARMTSGTARASSSRPPRRRAAASRFACSRRVRPAGFRFQGLSAVTRHEK